MTHASLCKETYETVSRLQTPKFRGAWVSALIILLIPASASIVLSAVAHRTGVLANADRRRGVFGEYSGHRRSVEFPGHMGYCCRKPAAWLGAEYRFDNRHHYHQRHRRTEAGQYSFEVEDEYNASAQTINMQNYTITVGALHPEGYSCLAVAAGRGERSISSPIPNIQLPRVELHVLSATCEPV